MKARYVVWLAAALALACGDSTPEPAAPPEAPVATNDVLVVERLDPELDDLLGPEAKIEVLAEGFDWAEGPIWVPEEEYLLFSDVPRNHILSYAEGEGASVWLEPSGYTGETPRGGEPGSNGLLIDPDGQLLLCQHGDRRIARLTASLEAPEPQFETIADRYDGKRFSSPNDLTRHPRGDLFFTDPPYGLDGGPDSPHRELDFQGVYRVDAGGTVHLVSDELSRPNGVAVSPDGKTLYVANSDPQAALWMAWDLDDDLEASNGRVFYDATDKVGDDAPGLPDGMKVDREGHLFATGPGGVWVFAPDGRALGRILTGKPTANCAFGDDGSSLYMTADDSLLRIRLTTSGLGF